MVRGVPGQIGHVPLNDGLEEVDYLAHFHVAKAFQVQHLLLVGGALCEFVHVDSDVLVDSLRPAPAVGAPFVEQGSERQDGRLLHVHADVLDGEHGLARGQHLLGASAGHGVLAQVEGQRHEHLQRGPVRHLAVLDERDGEQHGVVGADLGQQLHEEVPHRLLLVAGAHHDGVVEVLQGAVVQAGQQLQHLDGGLLVQLLGVRHHVGLAQALRHALQQRHHPGAGLVGGLLGERPVLVVQVGQADSPGGALPLDGLRHGLQALQLQRLAGLHVLHLGVGLERLQQEDPRGLGVQQRPRAVRALRRRRQGVHRLAVGRQRGLGVGGAVEGRHVAPVLLVPRLAALVVGELPHRLVATLAGDDVLDLALAVHRVLCHLGDGVRGVAHGPQVHLEQAGEPALHVVRPKRLILQDLDGGDPAAVVAEPEGAQERALVDGGGVADGGQRAHLAAPQRRPQLRHLHEGAAHLALHAHPRRQLPVAEDVAGQLCARVDLRPPLERRLDAVLEEGLGGRPRQQRQQQDQNRDGGPERR